MGFTERVAGLLRKKTDKQSPTPEQRLKLEDELGLILRKPDFEQTDFSRFVAIMVSLINENPDQGRLYDPDEKAEIDFLDYDVGGGSIDVHSGEGFSGSRAVCERIGYRDRLITEHQGGIRASEFVSPWVLRNEFKASIPDNNDIKFSSYVTGTSEPAFPTSKYYGEYDRLLSDIQVQDFCRRVYDVYLRSNQHGQVGHLHTK